MSGFDGVRLDDDQDLRSLVDGIRAVVWEADPRTRRFTFVSRHAEELLGFPVDRWLGEPDFLGSLADDRSGLAARWDRGDDFELVYRVTAADGRAVWLHDRVHVVRDDDGAVLRLRGVVLDVSEQRAAGDRHRFLAALEEELRRLDDAAEIMATVTRMLRGHLAGDRCAYARVEADEDHFVMTGDHATGLPSLRGRFAMSAFGELALRTMRAGEPWVVADSERDERLGAAERAVYAQTGIRAVVTVPFLRNGRFVAGLAVHQATARQWTPAEVELVSVVVNRCWESLQRTHADRALRDSEERHRLLVERATDGIWFLDHQLRFTEINPAACDYLGYPRERLIGVAVTEVAPDLAGRLDDLLTDLAEASVLTEVWDVQRADGTVVALELSIQATPTGLQAIGRDVTERRRADAERELLLQREHEIAATLQRSLLPRELPALDRLTAAARYLPAPGHGQIGGDWYEVVPVTGTTVALAVGDVVGKGPTAAAVMGQLRTALAGYLLDGHSPAAALSRLDTFAQRVNGAVGSTCACLTLDWDTGRLSWAVAGHPPPLVVGADGARLLSAPPGPVLGSPGHAPRTDHHTTLVPGGSVVLYTDGLVERRGEVVDQGLDRLLAVVGTSDRPVPGELADALTAEMLVDGQDDDVALVVVRRLPEPLRRLLPAEASELAAMRGQVAAWAGEAGLSPDLLTDLQLALGEAAANAVDHAYPDGGGDFDYEVATTATGVHVTVRDRGRWRPEPADKGDRGRGLQLIRAIAEDARVEHGEQGTTVDFTVPLDLTAAPVPQPAVEPGGDGVRLTGDVDVHTAGELRESVTARIAGANADRVELDLTGVGYLSSSGIALLLDAAATAARTGRVLTVVAVEGSAPARILALSGLTTGGPLVVRTVP